MKVFTESVGATQLRALTSLGEVMTNLHFYLAGGTALALQLGHRKSIDLDWFVAKKSSLNQPLTFSEILQSKQIPVAVKSFDDGTLHSTLFGVRVSFLRYKYPLVAPLIYWKEKQCNLASLRDIGSMKLVAIAQRGSKKDFIDLYALLEQGLLLHQMLDDYRGKFSTQNLAHVISALTYFHDADAEPTPRMLWRVNWRQIKLAIRESVKAYASSEGVAE